MWEKIKSWWVEYKARKEEKKMKERMDLEIALNQLLWDGPNWIAHDIHSIPKLIVSIFFESDKDWIAVDFSEEDKTVGISKIPSSVSRKTIGAFLSISNSIIS